MTDIEQPPNSALNVKLDYIQRDINEIKGDVKSIKSDYVSRREFETEFKDIETRLQAQFASVNEKVALLNRVLYWMITLLAGATGVSLLRLIIK